MWAVMFPCVSVRTMADGELPLSGSTWPAESAQTGAKLDLIRSCLNHWSWGVGTGRTWREK